MGTSWVPKIIDLLKRRKAQVSGESLSAESYSAPKNFVGHRYLHNSNAGYDG